MELEQKPYPFCGSENISAGAAPGRNPHPAAMGEAQIHAIAEECGMYQQHDNAKPSRDVVLSFVDTILKTLGDISEDAARYRFLVQNFLDTSVESDGKFQLPDYAELRFVWQRRGWENGKPYILAEVDQAVDKARNLKEKNYVAN